MTQALFRRASLRDAAAIARLEALCSPDGWSTTAVAKTLELPTTWAWTNTDSYLLSSVVEDAAEVLILGVRPSARRQGLGGALVTHAMQNWHHQGVSQAHLEVRAGNVAARALYEALGWTKQGQRARYYPGGEDAITYSLALAETAFSPAGS